MHAKELANEYRQLRHDGESDEDAAAIVDAMMIGDYVETKRARAERRIQAEKHERRPRQAA